MFPDPDKLNERTPAEVLDAAAHGHLGLDHRFLQALLDRPEAAKPAVYDFAVRDRSGDLVDLAPELIALFQHWRTPEAIPFLIQYIKEDPENVPDEAMEALVALGQPALEPLLALYRELDEAESGEVAFILASLRLRDRRILELLRERFEYDLSDTVLLLETHGDPAAIPALEGAASKLGSEDVELKAEIASAIESLQNAGQEKAEEPDAFDIWALYPEKEDLPVDLLDEDERLELFDHPAEDVRAAAVFSFFNRDLTNEQRAKILSRAQKDQAVAVRARAWEALISAVEDSAVLDAMLARLRSGAAAEEERAGLLIGLAPEADRNEVREAIVRLYSSADVRAKALEAMWRSMHPAFRDYFAKHLNDGDLETRRAAIWGIGYYGVKSELDRLREFFTDEELRADALFAYALALPTDVSRGRMKNLLSRIEVDAKGLSEMEEELVKAALDERLLLAGKEPVFRGQED
ncbi:MAG TPA: HEAT repeat domain-containing protein [Bryobacteraceae bacterium]